ncbi:hypothetical protein LguiB_030921 [Lonicera macranthoides]
MVNLFFEKDIQIVYKTAISLSASDAQILEELSKLMNVQTTIRNLGVSKSGEVLLHEISRVRFKGLSDDDQLYNGKLITNAFEMVNVIKKRELRVCFWTRSNGIEKEIYPSFNGINPSFSGDVNKIMWLGMSGITPKRLVDEKEQSEAKNCSTPKIAFQGTDVFKAAIEALPYEVEYEFIPFIENYYDLIYQVYLKNFDVVVGDIAITAKRSQYVDFMMSYTDLAVGTIERIENKDDYTATLSSLLTVQQIQGASKGDHIGYLSEDPVTIYHWVHHRDHKLRSYVSLEEFTDALSRRSQNGGAAAIIDEIPYIKIFLAKYSTNYAMVSSQPTSNGFGFIRVSSALALLRNEGDFTLRMKKMKTNFESNSNFDSVVDDGGGVGSSFEVVEREGD